MKTHVLIITNLLRHTREIGCSYVLVMLLILPLVSSCTGFIETELTPVELRVTGESSLQEKTSENYICTVYFDDGTEAIVTTEVEWEVTSSYASISSSGLLTVGSLPDDMMCIVTATYDRAGFTLSDTVAVQLLRHGDQDHSIQVTAPSGGETWDVFDTKTIRWLSQDAGSFVLIEYSTNGGSSWTTITSSTSNDGSYSWTIPRNPSSSCRVRVTSIAYSSATDESDDFEIRADADVTVASSPNPVTIDVGSNKLVTYAFTNAGACSVTFTQIVAAFFTPNGIRLTDDVTMSHELQIPELGTASWVDYTYLPPEVVSAAKSVGATSVVLHEAFVGTDCSGDPIQVADELTIKWPPDPVSLRNPSFETGEYWENPYPGESYRIYEPVAGARGLGVTDGQYAFVIRPDTWHGLTPRSIYQDNVNLATVDTLTFDWTACDEHVYGGAVARVWFNSTLLWERPIWEGTTDYDYQRHSNETVDVSAITGTGRLTLEVHTTNDWAEVIFDNLRVE